MNEEKGMLFVELNKALPDGVSFRELLSFVVST